MVVSLLGALRAPGAGAVSPKSVAAPAHVRAAPAPSGTAARLDVVQVNGLIDVIEADFLRKSIDGAAHSGAIALVVQLNSGGGVISRARLDALSFTVARANVPVAVWVGPNGSRAYGAAYAIFRAARLRGVAPGTRVGKAPPPLSGPPDPLVGRGISSDQALRAGAATIGALTLGDFIVDLDGQRVGGKTLHTAKVVRGAGGAPRRQPTVVTRFEKFDLLQQLFHTAASPSVAYLLLVIGLLLAVLEFFTAGVGIAAFCAGGLLVLASYGLGVLPVHGWAIVLIALGVFGLCVDLQSGVPRVWTVIGVVALAGGSLSLYHGVSASPLALIAGVVGSTLFMVAGMPAMVRARFSTPTIGRESMIGEMGIALGAIEPEGTVEIRGAPWRARTNRATPIAVGEPIRVVAIDGVLLEVEPEVGGARDAHH